MKKTKTPLTERELCVLAGWFARSNMGQPRAGREMVQRILTQKYEVSVNSAAIHFCAEFMESEEHERIFDEEAQGWYKSLKKEHKSRESLLKTWPELDAYFWTEPEKYEYAGFSYYVIKERNSVTMDPVPGQHRNASLDKYKRAAAKCYEDDWIMRDAVKEVK